MRLIDAGKLEKDIRRYADNVGCGRGEYELANGILKALSVVNDCPTAYDLDKVVEQLDNLFPLQTAVGTFVSKGDVIGLMKGGGVDE